MASKINRRNALKNIVAGTAVVGVSSGLSALAMDKPESNEPLRLKGNINHAVCRWCFSSFDVEALCVEAKKLGLKALIW